MIPFLRSGKFWLKLISFGGLAVLMLILSLYLALHQLFSPERMHSLADSALAGTGRNARFSSQIDRSWLPRPTVTLYKVVITKPNSATAAVMIKEMRIGMAWSNLWNSRPEIEKWQIRQAEIELLRDSNGHWSLQDLWEKPGNPLTVNRLVLENSRINIHLPKHSYLLHDLNARIGSDGNGRPFEGSGSIEGNTFKPISWRTNGIFTRNRSAWQIPQLHVEADTAQHGQNFSLSADTALSWQLPQKMLVAKNTRLRADSPFYNLHLTAENPLLRWDGNHIQINRINGVYTADKDRSRLDGSFMLANANLRPSVVTVDEFESNNNLQTAAYRTTANLTGNAVWQQNHGLSLDNLKLTTLQDGAGSLSRFNAQLGGSFVLDNRNHWQTALQGTFDRQPVSLNAAYRHENDKTAQISGKLNLQKLALDPYWKDLQTPAGNLYPQWLSASWSPEIDAHISIGSISMPGLQLDSLDSDLFANQERITLSNFKAGLYGGQTEGGLSMNNTQPPSYHLQQNATGIQVRPLLQDLFANNNISGRGQAVIDLTAQGSNRTELTRSLNGSLQLMVSDGAWIGFDLNNILQRASNNANAGKDYDRTLQTPFRRFSALTMIENGVSTHENVELASDLLAINSSGSTDFNTQMLSENLLIHNVKNPQAKPIPLKISGPIDNPSVTIDFQRLTYGLNTPEEKRRALAETLREQWQWLNPRHNTTPPIKP